MTTVKKTTRVGLLVAALIGGAIAAAATRSVPKSDAGRNAPRDLVDPISQASSPDPAPDHGAELQGQVLEVIHVPNYTYLRFESEGRPVWAAVNASPELKAGDSARVGQAQLMQNFHSASLNRDFEAIYFGVLEPAAGVRANARANSRPSGEVGPSPTGGVNPHALPPTDPGVELGRVTRAAGELGHTIAEIHANKSRLAGKTVRVRAVVVKVTPDVMGRTFAHVRDGSGTPAAQDFDLTVTTRETPNVRQTVLLEGRLDLDVDFGAGYKYPLILQDARVTSE